MTENKIIDKHTKNLIKRAFRKKPLIKQLIFKLAFKIDKDTLLSNFPEYNRST